MSEFKFACPVCGQHITADSHASGARLECPTCFRKILIPQAPASGDSRLILSAVQADKARPTAFDSSGNLRPRKKSAFLQALNILAVLLVAGAAGAAAWKWGGNVSRLFKRPAPPPAVKADDGINSPYPVPTNVVWNLRVQDAMIPEARVAGSIHGNGFQCERAILQGGALSLRQGKAGTANLSVTVGLFAKRGEDLGGKTVVISPEREPPLPKVTLRWKAEETKPVSEQIPAGYLLKVVFGEPVDGRMPGKIYLALPDESRSFVAGTFEAEIRQPRPPKPRR